MRTVNRFGAATLLGLRAGDLPARLAPELHVIASRLPEPQRALAGGAAFQRLWLTAQSLDLALQPMAASAVLHDDVLLHGAGLRLDAGWTALLGAGWAPIMVCRIGRASPPRVRSLRRAASDYLVPADGGPMTS